MLRSGPLLSDDFLCDPIGPNDCLCPNENGHRMVLARLNMNIRNDFITEAKDD